MKKYNRQKNTPSGPFALSLRAAAHKLTPLKVFAKCRRCRMPLSEYIFCLFYFSILSIKSILQPFRLCFRWAGHAGLFSGPAREIFFLFFGQLVNFKIHSRKLVSSDLIVDAVRNVINLFCELFSMFRKPLKAEGLYGE